jgi:hypothetical protein
MIETYNLAEHPAFKTAQSLVSDALCDSLKVDWPKAVELLTAGQNVDLRGNFELVVQLESCLLELMKASPRFPTLKSVQFPANIRIVHNVPPKGYLDRPFATDFPHCDVWSDAPADSTNIFFYLFTFGNCARLELYESIENDPYSRDFRGPYSAYKGDVSKFKLMPTPVGAGIMHYFDTFCPHRTVRGTDGLRISIDLRARSEVPYILDGAPMASTRFSGYTPGVPGNGIYWTKPSKALDNFAAKCEFEMRQAAAIGPWATALRLEYIDKITTVGAFV